MTKYRFTDKPVYKNGETMLITIKTKVGFESYHKVTITDELLQLYDRAMRLSISDFDYEDLPPIIYPLQKYCSELYTYFRGNPDSYGYITKTQARGYRRKQ